MERVANDMTGDIGHSDMVNDILTGNRTDLMIGQLTGYILIVLRIVGILK